MIDCLPAYRFSFLRWVQSFVIDARPACFFSYTLGSLHLGLRSDILDTQRLCLNSAGLMSLYHLGFIPRHWLIQTLWFLSLELIYLLVWIFSRTLVISGWLVFLFFWILWGREFILEYWSSLRTWFHRVEWLPPTGCFHSDGLFLSQGIISFSLCGRLAAHD